MIEIYDGATELAKDFSFLHKLHAKTFGPGKPFYWTRVHDDLTVSAPSGWYQWTESGLAYLGESISEGANG